MCFGNIIMLISSICAFIPLIMILSIDWQFHYENNPYCFCRKCENKRKKHNILFKKEEKELAEKIMKRVKNQRKNQRKKGIKK